MAKKPSGKPQEQQNISTSNAGSAAQTSNGNGNASARTGDGAQTSGVSFSSDEIAARAYEIYEREGRSDGRDMDHWLRAESELRMERQQRQPSIEPRAEVQQRQSNPQSRQELPRSARQHQPTTGV
jgi:hypothetical protein